MEYLLDKYKPLVKRQARTMYLIGGENDDLIQEGMIGLFKAVSSYRPEEGAFFAFAELCVTRQMYTAVQASNRMKHAPLNSYVSLDEEPQILTEQNPENLIIDRENLEKRYEQIHRRLTDMEKEVLELYLEGKTYEQIAGMIGKNEKAVDNTIQRLKKKLDKDEKRC
ncbi:MAG: sigma-70 family RNA polymerase sigma factor [Clostridiales bacterium]|nr:sigma-70 family RNA polymerase sigma factor [Clostridiales bacterium]